MSDLNGRVKLNVGGQVFETTVGTLKRVPDTALARLVEDNWESCSSYEPIFIDHDPKYFNLVLNFLRDGRFPLPDDVNDVDEIKREAQYFEMYPMVDFINSEEQKGPPFFRGDRVVWKDQNFQRSLTKLGWSFDGTTPKEKRPLCFQPETGDELQCGLCGVTTSAFDKNYRSIFSKERNVTFTQGEVRKVYKDCCCVDVTFANFIYIFHIPSKLLVLTDGPWYAD